MDEKNSKKTAANVQRTYVHNVHVSTTIFLFRVNQIYSDIMAAKTNRRPFAKNITTIEQ